jgi:hypothetical protein
MCNIRKGVPGLFPEVATALGEVHQRRRGVLWTIRLTHLQACPKKLYKKSSETFWTDHICIRRNCLTEMWKLQMPSCTGNAQIHKCQYIPQLYKNMYYCSHYF